MGKKFELKLVDFGFSSKVEKGSYNTTNIGTPGYQCPEIILGQEYDSRKADVFALGVIIYVFIKGSPPFRVANI